MKKIVALVLCLALALSLCTVAFAGDYFKVANGVKDGGKQEDTHEWTMVKIANADANKNTVDVYTLVGKKDNAETIYKNYYVITDDVCADTLFVEGTKSVYLETVTSAVVVKDATATAVDTKNWKAEDLTCGDIVAYDNSNLYKTSAGQYYIETGVDTDEKVLVGDQLVYAKKVTLENHCVDLYTSADLSADEAAKIVHEFEVDFDTDEGKVIIEKVECVECDATFTFTTTEADAIAWGVSYDTIAKTGYTTKDTTDCGWLNNSGKTVFVKTGSASTTTSGSNSSTTVESAKTFDAGIALYAGMALASVAGSAVVIGKKKEF